MKAEDITDTLQLALAASGCDQARVIHKPRLLSDNGSSYVSADLAEWLDDKGTRHQAGGDLVQLIVGSLNKSGVALANGGSACRLDPQLRDPLVFNGTRSGGF